MVQNAARMANGAHTMPPPHIFHAPWLFKTYLYFISGWDWQWGEHGGRKANRPGLGGPNGGEDQCLYDLFVMFGIQWGIPCVLCVKLSQNKRLYTQLKLVTSFVLMKLV